MTALTQSIIESPLGKIPVDSAGPPIAVVRLDPDKSYAGVNELLQAHINGVDAAAWETIRNKIDYTYENLNVALGALEKATEFGVEIRLRLERGQKLLFKPNLVNPANIDPETHGPDMGSTACTEWPFVAALMRWFHDKLGVSYHNMALGEAATCMQATAGVYSIMNPYGYTIPTEAVLEGKFGEFHAGWGFYFVRKYLAQSLDDKATDNPMNGYEESLAGTFIPPGHVRDKLMVYDLNRIFDNPSKGRDVVVPDGINFKSLTLHKVIVGGSPEDPDDRTAYPGCILINVPKLKVHSITLLTNAIKNLGIGLYPMQTTKTHDCKWDYSNPHNSVPGMKGNIPHQIWVPELDPTTNLPKRDAQGEYITKETGGINATMIDIIKAVHNQDVFMVHVVDGIETINIDHTGMLPGTRTPEGMVFAGLDPVAVDLLSARYLFSNVPLEEAMNTDVDDGSGGRFPQRVSLPSLEGDNIVTRMGYDCPISRDRLFERAQKSGLGKRTYHVVGRDAVSDDPIICLKGHLGRISNGSFSDILTKTLYFDAFKMPWDLQHTAFAYLKAVDDLTGSSLKESLLEALDEDADGIVTYEDFGKKGMFAPMLQWGGEAVSLLGTEEFGYFKGFFASRAVSLKCSNPMWNSNGHDILEIPFYGAICLVAYRMSQMELEMPDPFVPSLTWGHGKWPSFELARFIYLGIILYGDQFPNALVLKSLYGFAFQYADLTQNEGRYSGPSPRHPQPDAISKYIEVASNGRGKPLDFTLYVPEGFGSVAGAEVPNVECTSDPSRIFTSVFAGGKETWPAV